MSDPFIKVCGVRDPATVRAAIAAGATALGFNFVPSSRRAVSVDTARELVALGRSLAGAPPLWVGIFADAEVAAIEATRRAVGLDLVQLHGHEPPDMVARCQPGYKAVRVGRPDDLAALAELPGPFVLIDARVESQLGGTGRRIPVELVARATALRPVIVAGGLDAGNVEEVILATRPAGVDTAGGAEDECGAPDPEAARRFVEAARAGFDRLREERAHV